MEVALSTDSLVAQSELVFSTKGRLATAIPGFVARAAQVQLAAAIAQTIVDQSVLVAEAGTGTGKTFAYLIPCLLNRKKTLISTATKTLQDQLYQKDLPLLTRALGLSVRVQNLKGRANYLCRYRIALHAEEGRFAQSSCAHELLHVREKLAQLTAGERSELPEIAEDSTIWPYVTSTSDNCLGTECGFHQTCFLVKARKRAMDADVVIINHHLFFADSRLKEEGFGELLPGVNTVIFDEAHQLADIAANFHGKRISSRQLRDLANDVLKEWPVLDLANQPLQRLSLHVEEVFDQLLLALPGHIERLAWNELSRYPSFLASWERLTSLVGELLACFATITVDTPGLERCLNRLNEYKAVLQQLEGKNKTHVHWVERFKHNLIFHSTPFDVAETFQETISKGKCAYVFTSATLTMASSFSCFTKPLGLHAAKTLFLPSPFNYEEQALLYLPRSLPDPKDSQYYEQLIKKALPLIEACGGRCFFLFTSHRALKLVAQLLANNLNYPLLIQGEEAKPILLARFRQLGNAVLLGTSTFWEGVDVKGQALSCVIIDKLPFSNPADPVVQGKIAYLRSCNLSDFDELSLPNAILALKQGVGRLIRDTTDKGVLMIADPRLTGREYGRTIFASLPALKKTRDERTVLTFIKNLALEYELAGN